MALGTVIDEGRLEAGFYPGDASLVNVGFGLNPHAGFNIKIVELLPINQRNPKFLGLGGVDQHPFHAVHSSEGVAGRALGESSGSKARPRLAGARQRREARLRAKGGENPRTARDLSCRFLASLTGGRGSSRPAHYP